MKPRPIEFLQEGARVVARVSLGRDPVLKAEILKEDLDFLIKLGVSSNWTALKVNGQCYVSANASNNPPSNKVLVSRALLDAGPGQIVKYVDGNPLNLRRENLRLVSGKGAIKRARDFLRPTHILEVIR